MWEAGLCDSKFIPFHEVWGTVIPVEIIVYIGDWLEIYPDTDRRSLGTSDWVQVSPDLESYN